MEIGLDCVIVSIASTLASIILQIVVLFLSIYRMLSDHCTDLFTVIFLFLLIWDYFLTILFQFSASIGTHQLHFLTLGSFIGNYIF